jgi:hypothetical protein
MSRSTQKNGALRASAAGAAGIGGSTWQPIAIRDNNGMGHWRTLPSAPVTPAEARELMRDFPGKYTTVQKREANVTYLLFKGPQV